MVKRPIRPSDIRLGEPLPGDVYDAKHTLLLRRGHLVASPWQLELLRQQAVLVDDATSAPHVTSEALARATQRSPLAELVAARGMLDALLTQPPASGFPDEVMEVAGMLIRACQLNPDLALATILMQCHEPYSAHHAVDVAIVCQVIGSVLRMPVDELTVTVAAALTMNIAMAALQDRLQSHPGPLDPALLSEIRSHPERGAALLQQLGVDDPLWLAAVRDHHEQVDGNGYPQGKAGSAIALPARLMLMADIYCARVSSREFRPAILPNVVMRWLFLDHHNGIDKGLSELFIKTLGIYPPGTGVRLRNGGYGVVTQRGTRSHQPRIAAVTTADGQRLASPIRLGHDSDGAIAEVVDLATLQLEPEMAWLWGRDAAL